MNKKVLLIIGGVVGIGAIVTLALVLNNGGSLKGSLGEIDEVGSEDNSPVNEATEGAQSPLPGEGNGGGFGDKMGGQDFGGQPSPPGAPVLPELGVITVENLTLSTSEADVSSKIDVKLKADVAIGAGDRFVFTLPEGFKYNAELAKGSCDNVNIIDQLFGSYPDDHVVSVSFQAIGNGGYIPANTVMTCSVTELFNPGKDGNNGPISLQLISGNNQLKALGNSGDIVITAGQYQYNPPLTIKLNPASPEGSSTGSVSKEIFRFDVTAGDNPKDPEKNRVDLQTINITTIKNGVSVKNLKIDSVNYHFDDSYSSICTAISSIKWSCPINSKNHTNEIEEGTKEAFIVRADVGSGQNPVNTLDVSIATLGTPDSPGDVTWNDETGKSSFFVDQNPSEVKGGTLIFGANSGTYVYNTTPTFKSHISSPFGATKGAISKEIFIFNVAASANISEPQAKVFLKTVYLSAFKTGGVKVSNLVVYPALHDNDATYETICYDIVDVHSVCILNTASGNNEIVQGEQAAFIVHADVVTDPKQNGTLTPSIDMATWSDDSNVGPTSELGVNGGTFTFAAEPLPPAPPQNYAPQASSTSSVKSLFGAPAYKSNKVRRY